MKSISKIREDFPILKAQVNDKTLVYLDNAATTQKPKTVIEAINNYYQNQNSNVHRGVHSLSQLATQKYESTREIVKNFIVAKSTDEIIFTRGTTESINLIAQSYGRSFLNAGDEIIISQMEHHSNIVPWQILCGQISVKLKVIDVTDSGELNLKSLEKLLSDKTKIVSLMHVSNTLGTINPIKEIIKIIKNFNKDIIVSIDGAQAVQHLKVNVLDLGCDFYSFSGHKIYGPTGVGVLYGKRELLNKMPPWQGGGDMIASVSFDKTTYNILPYKFEAGTPNIAGVIGLGEAIKYVQNLGLDFIYEQEKKLLDYAFRKLSQIKEVKIIGQAKEKSAVISFILKDIHAHDVGTILDQSGVAIRAGHHCTQPLMERFNVPATVRASFAFYNTEEEVDNLIDGIKKTLEIFK
ncbi:MAG: cysteine desulfurase [Oligoflexia bacterium]|nr:cysteine desulfurase [Oligoflexia bacterium]